MMSDMLQLVGASNLGGQHGKLKHIGHFSGNFIDNPAPVC